jgi:hypothetical protein
VLVNFGHVTTVPSTVEPLSPGAVLLQTEFIMNAEPNTGKNKDNLRVEKLSLLILSLCIMILVYVLVVRPF